MIAKHTMPSTVDQAVARYMQRPEPPKPATNEERIVIELALALEGVANARLAEIMRDLKAVVPVATITRSRESIVPQQLLELQARTVASDFGYRPSLKDYHLWIWLGVLSPNWFSDFVISFQPLGPILRGVMTTVAIIVEGVPQDSRVRTGLQDRDRVYKSKAACAEPFDITYLDDLHVVQPLFEQWLDAAIIRAFNEFERYRPAPAPFPTETPNA